MNLAGSLGRLFRQFIAFAGVGAAATAIQYVVLIGLVEFFAIRAAVASGIGFVLSAVVNYLLNYHFTFASTSPHATAARRFVTIAAAGLFLNVALMALLADRLHWPYLIAQILTTGLVVVWTFCGNAFWSFASPAGARGRQGSREDRR
jgi:putative flippase GtrA